MLGVERLGRPLTPELARFVANPVQQRAADVSLERPFVPGLERGQAPNDMRQRLLDDVVGVDGSAGAGGQPAVGPARQPGQIPRAEIVERVDIPFPCARDQDERSVFGFAFLLLHREPAW